VPNRLREHRLALGLEQWAVAERISALTEDGTLLDAHAVSRHERGLYTPRRFYRRLYCQVFQATEEVLWPPGPALVVRDDEPADEQSVDRDLVLVAPWDAGGTVEAAVALAGSDGLVERRTFVFLSGAALTAPAHQWLVHEPGPLQTALRGDRVTPLLADRLPPMVAELRRMDDVSGGGVVLGLAEREFGWVAWLLDHASYDEKTRWHLHGVLAELGQFTGWVACDAGLHALAQRYWIAALRAAHTADDAALAAFILTSMAHQAAEQGRPAEAVTLIETALAGVRGRQTPALLALLHSDQAYAKAILQDGSGSVDAETRAERWAEQIRPEQEPPRLYWVNRADIAAHSGRALLRLGRAEQAVRPLADGVRQLDGSMVRDRQLYLADWAEALGRPGRQQDVEEAACRGMEAVALAEGLCSTRGRKRIGDLCTQMRPHATVPTVREFLDRARELG